MKNKNKRANSSRKHNVCNNSSSAQILPELQHFTNTDDSMLTPPNINDFWELETIGTTPQEEKEHDEAVMDQFKR